MTPVPGLLVGLVLFILIGWGVGAAWTSVVGSSEVELMQEIAAHRTAGLTAIAKVVTWAGSGFVLVPTALASGLLLARAGHPRQAVAVAVGLAGAMLISTVVKSLVARPRPPVEHLQRVTGWSFPSGHATQASAFWFSLALAVYAVSQLSGWAVVLPSALLACLVALSRVYLGVHYPSDVIAGVPLGTGWAFNTARCIGYPMRSGHEVVS